MEYSYLGELPNDYDILDQLHENDKGFCCLIRHKQTYDFYVAKVIYQLDETDDQLDCILNEANILETLKNSGVVQLYDKIIRKECVILILEHCSGGDLKALIKSKRDVKDHFSEDEVRNMFIQLLTTMNFIHSKNVLHRDIKPANFLVTNKGLLKFADFGTAITTDTDTINYLQLVGTYLYMAPEILAGEPYTYKSDLWSLGCVFYELCAYTEAFNSDNLTSLAFDICFEQAEPIRTYSHNITQIIQLLLNKDPLKRPSADYLLGIRILKPIKALNDYFQNSTASQLLLNILYFKVFERQYQFSFNTFTITTFNSFLNSYTTDCQIGLEDLKKVLVDQEKLLEWLQSLNLYLSRAELTYFSANFLTSLSLPDFKSWYPVLKQTAEINTASLICANLRTMFTKLENLYCLTSHILGELCKKVNLNSFYKLQNFVSLCNESSCDYETAFLVYTITSKMYHGDVDLQVSCKKVSNSVTLLRSIISNKNPSGYSSDEMRVDCKHADITLDKISYNQTVGLSAFDSNPIDATSSIISKLLNAKKLMSKLNIGVINPNIRTKHEHITRFSGYRSSVNYLRSKSSNGSLESLPINVASQNILKDSVKLDNKTQTFNFENPELHKDILFFDDQKEVNESNNHATDLNKFLLNTTEHSPLIKIDGITGFNDKASLQHQLYTYSATEAHQTDQTNLSVGGKLNIDGIPSKSMYCGSSTSRSDSSPGADACKKQSNYAIASKARLTLLETSCFPAMSMQTNYYTTKQINGYEMNRITKVNKPSCHEFLPALDTEKLHNAPVKVIEINNNVSSLPILSKEKLSPNTHNLLSYRINNCHDLKISKILPELINRFPIYFDSESGCFFQDFTFYKSVLAKFNDESGNKTDSSQTTEDVSVKPVMQPILSRTKFSTIDRLRRNMFRKKGDRKPNRLLLSFFQELAGAFASVYGVANTGKTEDFKVLAQDSLPTNHSSNIDHSTQPNTDFTQEQEPEPYTTLESTLQTDKSQLPQCISCLDSPITKNKAPASTSSLVYTRSFLRDVAEILVESRLLKREFDTITNFAISFSYAMNQFKIKFETEIYAFSPSHTEKPLPYGYYTAVTKLLKNHVTTHDTEAVANDKTYNDYLLDHKYHNANKHRQSIPNTPDYTITPSDFNSNQTYFSLISTPDYSTCSSKKQASTIGVSRMFSLFNYIVQKNMDVNYNDFLQYFSNFSSALDKSNEKLCQSYFSFLFSLIILYFQLWIWYERVSRHSINNRHSESDRQFVSETVLENSKNAIFKSFNEFSSLVQYPQVKCISQSTAELFEALNKLSANFFSLVYIVIAVTRLNLALEQTLCYC